LRKTFSTFWEAVWWTTRPDLRVPSDFVCLQIGGVAPKGDWERREYPEFNNINEKHK